MLYRGRRVGVYDAKDATREQLGYLLATGAEPEAEAVAEAETRNEVVGSE